MAAGDFPGSPVVLCLREGLPGSGSATPWTNDGSGTDPVLLATGVVVADPGDGENVARHTADLGYDLNVTGGTTWTFGCALDATSLSSFRNILSSDTGGADGSIYCNAGDITIEDTGNTETTGYTLSTGTIYRIIIVRNASNYRIYVNGALEYTSTMTPAATTVFVTSAYGGSGAAWSGDWYGMVLYTSDESANVADIDAALSYEPDGDPANEASGDETAPAPTNAGTVTYTWSASGAETAPLPTESGSVDIPVTTKNASGDETVPLATNSGAIAYTQTATGGETAPRPVESGTADQNTDLSDPFDGTGSLTDWSTINAASLPGVEQTGGYYRAPVPSHSGTTTTHFNTDYGRLDYRLVEFPFEAIANGVRIADISDPETTVSFTSEYAFCGLQIQNDPSSPTDAYQHAVVGRRGPNTGSAGGNTLERKTTTSGSSTQNDIGPDAVPGLIVDIRVVGTAGTPNTIEWYYRIAGDTAWTALTMPGTEPSWDNEIAFGLVTYAYLTISSPGFAGYIDEIVVPSDIDASATEIAPLPTEAGTGEKDANASAGETAPLPSNAGTLTATHTATGGETTPLPSDDGAAAIDGVLAALGGEVAPTPTNTGTASIATDQVGDATITLARPEATITLTRPEATIEIIPMATTRPLRVGDRVTVSTEFTTSTGAAADPTTVTVYVLSPSGVLATYLSPSNPSVGTWTQDVDMTEGGTWRFRVEGAGALVAVEEASEIVRESDFS